MSAQKILGIDIGGTKCGVILAEYDAAGGDIAFIDKYSFPTDKDANKAIEMLLAKSEAMLLKHRLTPTDIAAAGINCGGPLDSKNGIILKPPNLLGWIDIPIVEITEKRLGIKSYLQNDANAGAIAEHMFGAGKGCDNIIFLTFGTGMGAGLILNGRLYSGTNDMAGEVGHIRLDTFGPAGFGKAGSFEGFCSGGGIAQLARTMALTKLQIGETCAFCTSESELGQITAKTVADAAHAGDTLAKEVFAVCGRYLGKALSLFIDILNPQIIILGTIYSYAKEFIYEHMREVIDAETIPYSRKVCNITESGLGGAINDYEAVSIAIYGKTACR